MVKMLVEVWTQATARTRAMARVLSSMTPAIAGTPSVVRMLGAVWMLAIAGTSATGRMLAAALGL